MNIRFLDGLRGIAAYVVMIGHAQLLLWEGYSSGFELHRDAYTLLDKTLMFAFSIFRYGHEMVILFFVLSGFVIHLRFADRTKKTDINVKTFWYKRIKRLYPPLLFTFALAFVIDSIGKHYGWSIYTHQTPYPNINRSITSNLDGVTLLGNLSFLMSVYVNPFGTSIVTWSLMYEWWFYICYPFFYYLTQQFGFRKTSFFIAVLSLLCSFQQEQAYLLATKVLSHFVIWWMGACLVEVWMNRETSTKRLYELSPYLIWCLPIAFIAKEAHSSFFPPSVNLLFGLGFTGLIAVLLRLKPENLAIRLLNMLKPLGDCSYTLYLIHVTIFVFISGAIITYNGVLPKHHFYVIGGSILIPILAYYLHFLIEKPFTKTRKVPEKQIIYTKEETCQTSI
jgi:peptidoglycan/LPS O-acetylase OafA/YrhL